MASLAAACRLSARVVRSRVVADTTARSYRTSARCLAAQNFTMPALSPTMTEGNIATWKVKEGEAFAAGDVLLEIETDKATMDVEAQDDGVLMKITQGDGSKSVQVGTRIGVIAEPDDDIATLEMPAEDAKAAPEQSAGESTPAAQETKKDEGKKSPVERPAGGEAHKVRYPLLPSVQSLVMEHGLDESAVSQITPTGPNGRLLKGDILAHVGSINAETPAKLSSLFEKLSRLDLGNIKVAPKKEEPAPKKEEKPAPAAPAVPQDAQLTVPVSLAKVVEVQQKIHNSVGAFLPLSSFIARATDVANDELPRVPHPPTSDELFNDVLGVPNTSQHGTRGAYVPSISVPRGPSPAAGSVSARSSDIIDILAATKKSPARRSVTTPGLSTGTNLFSLTVPKAEEKRASAFLERVKLILEKEPARLVL